ncbi:hypothetical protein BJ165DRAFT_1530852 [Panaeolus papilionaceus]|nr:hypothetical protein BJ165DRAFT_1530852 [Panaeolus papilionaceus]
MSDNFQPPNLFTPTEAPGEQEKRLQDTSLSTNPTESTPDNTKPGVFPGDYPAVETPLNYPPASAVSGIAQSAYQTATGALQTVGETVKPYLPEAVASYLPGSTSPNQQTLQSQQSTQVRAPQDSSLTSDVTSSLHGDNSVKNWPSQKPTSSSPSAPFLAPSSNPVLEDAAHATDKSVSAVKSTTAPAANTLSAKAGDAVTYVQQTAASVGNTIAGMAPESIGQYLPNRDTNTIPTGPGHQQVPSTNIAATTTIPPLTKPSNANTHTAQIAGSTDISPLNKPSSSIVQPTEVAGATHINPLSKPSDSQGCHGSTAIAPKKSTAVAPARVDLESQLSQVALTTQLPPLDKQGPVVENTEVAGATSIAPLEKGANDTTTSSSTASRATQAVQSKTAEATQHVQSVAKKVESEAAQALPSRSTHDDDAVHKPLRSRSPAKGDRTAHPKAATGDNLHAPATTTVTKSGRGLPHSTTITHTKDDPAHKVLARHGAGIDDDDEKPSMKDKVKGEMKVIAGKIGRNEEKVEEGKKLMGKAVN